jgi:uncharacterized membrane protein YagU involved in acid resistance
MIRRVAFDKAVFAGAAGAVAWEVVLRLLLLTGLPLFDLVRVLGTMMLGHAPVWQWWLIGMLLHMSVGAIWAVFYAYFFWSTFNWRPLWQGIVFSLGPAFLAGFIMVPQMSFMHRLVLSGELPGFGLFGSNFGWGGPAAIIFGHLVYGTALGVLYTRPVGYAVRRRETSHG